VFAFNFFFASEIKLE